MTGRISTEEIERLIFDVVTESNCRAGDALPVNAVYQHAEQKSLSRNQVCNGILSLKNKHLLTAQEKVTQEFFQYFNRESVPA